MLCILTTEAVTIKNLTASATNVPKGTKENSMKEMIQIIDIKYILLYFLIINLVGFFAMGIDKFKAQRGYWRIPEGTLIMITAFGGGIGTLTRNVHIQT